MRNEVKKENNMSLHIKVENGYLFHEEWTGDYIIYYYAVNQHEMVIATYYRPTTITTYALTALPRSMR